ncbi:hypothetical protein FCZ48_14045 [Escherichia coli]|nr:hypothetical protein [Escherichia coli]EFO2788159.1 hypothetical protein [Escherichia coli]MDN1905596.1 hypothetical protein [Escherichia coli]HAW0817023.1 hypothetical protein [Escherichia coli]
MLFSGFACADNDDCQISVSQTIVDYKTLRRDAIITSQQGWNKFPERDVTVNVSCLDEQQMAVQVQGNAGEQGRFIFGQRGGVGLKINSLTIDGSEYGVGKTRDMVNFLPESNGASPIYIRNNEAVIGVKNDQVVKGKQMSISVTLFPVINDSMFSGVSDNTELITEITWRLFLK